MLWNGPLRLYAPQAHAWAAARSFDDLTVLLDQAGFVGMYDSTRRYWHAGSWGRLMDGIAPERGIWVQKDYGSPVTKLYPAATVRRLGRSRPS